jgi:hypothetical protein
MNARSQNTTPTIRDATNRHVQDQASAGWEGCDNPSHTGPIDWWDLVFGIAPTLAHDQTQGRVSGALRR